MQAVLTLPDRALTRIDTAIGDLVLGTGARIVFAGVLFFYFWNSALTKVGDGLFGLFQPSAAAYIQIFPKTVEALGYDFSKLGLFHWAVAVSGTVAEFVLPVLLIVGLFTRLAALGMIGFVVVQSYVDITGHNAAAQDIGAWFDGPSGALIADQRAMWIFLLAYLVVKGGGPLALDRLLARPNTAET